MIFNERGINMYIIIRWAKGVFKYTISPVSTDTSDGNTTEFNLDTTQLNHIAFEYLGNNKLTVWINGMQKKQHNLILGSLSHIIVGVKELGILSLYNRDLNKAEIVQHFIDNHVENFTNDEVLN